MPLSEALSGKVVRVHDALQKSSLPFEKKEQLYDIVGSAVNSANGSPDKIQSMSETLLLSVLLNVEDRLQADQVLTTAIATATQAHDERCPFKNSRYGRAVGLAVLFKWPIVVVACTAMVTKNVEVILEAVSKFF